MGNTTGRAAENVVRKIDRDAVMWEVDTGRSLVGDDAVRIFVTVPLCYVKDIGQFCGLAMTVL